MIAIARNTLDFSTPVTSSQTCSLGIQISFIINYSPASLSIHLPLAVLMFRISFITGYIRYIQIVIKKKKEIEKQGRRCYEWTGFIFYKCSLAYKKKYFALFMYIFMCNKHFEEWTPKHLHSKFVRCFLSSTYLLLNNLLSSSILWLSSCPTSSVSSKWLLLS